MTNEQHLYNLLAAIEALDPGDSMLSKAQYRGTVRRLAGSREPCKANVPHPAPSFGPQEPAMVSVRGDIFRIEQGHTVRFAKLERTHVSIPGTAETAPAYGNRETSPTMEDMMVTPESIPDQEPSPRTLQPSRMESLLSRTSGLPAATEPLLGRRFKLIEVLTDDPRPLHGHQR